MRGRLPRRARGRCPRGDGHASRQPGGGGQPAARPHRPHRRSRPRACSPPSRASRASRSAWRAAKPWGPPRSRATSPRASAASGTAAGRATSARSTCCSTSSTGAPFVSEVPFHAPDRVTPAAPIADLARAAIAMVTTGGLVKKGNPDRQVAANATRYHRHSVEELEALTPEGWEAYHAGYFNHIVNKNPNYILPLSFLRDLEGKGQIGRVHEWMYALPGVSTPVAHGARARAEHRGGSPGGARRRRPPRRHLRDLQSLRRNDSEGDRASGNPGGHDLGHLQLRDDDGRQPRGARRAHRARLRRSRPRAREGLRVRHAHRDEGARGRHGAGGGADAVRPARRPGRIQGRRPMRLELGSFPVRSHRLRRRHALGRRPPHGGQGGRARRGPARPAHRHGDIWRSPRPATPCASGPCAT